MSIDETHTLGLDVALSHPALPFPPRPTTACIVVDVIRATTTLTVLAERGWPRVLAARDVASARAAVARQGYLLLGEVHGLPPPDFDLGNSPADVATLPRDGRVPVLVTTNGTVALHRCEGAGLTLAGSLRNARAVAHAALAFARGRGGDVLIVCAGRGAEPALDDTLCAGVICQEVLALAHESELALADGAHIALTLADAAHDDDARQKLLELSGAARYTRSIGLGHDLDWCAVTNASDAVPSVVGHDGDLLMIERYAEPGRH